MTANSSIAACLAGLPFEILLDVYQRLDLQAVFKLSLSNSDFWHFFQRRKADILLPVLIRDFSPFNELLQVYTASAADVAKGGRYIPRTVVLKRFHGDKGTVLSQSPAVANTTAKSPGNGFTEVSKSGKPATSSSQTSPTVVFTALDLDDILKHCRLVQEWQDIFPQMRWFHQSEDCRLLRPHEQERFRRALYRWWLYGIYFHGDCPRPRIGHPEPLVDDIRTSQMRRYPTGELLELMDLLETVKDVILHYICPRLDPTDIQYSDHENNVDQMNRSQSLSIGWNDQSHWSRIVKTYVKLGPEDLLYYFNNIYSYPRKRLITEIHLRHPTFTFDQESIQIAIRCALDERNWLVKNPSLAEHNVGGIVDFDDERDIERSELLHDANLDGSLPRGLSFVPSYSRYSPRGDDGEFIEDYLRLSTFETRIMSLGALRAAN